MTITTFLKTTALCVAAALVAFAFYGNDLLFLAKALALAFATSIVFTLAYPHIRGVRKGDKVFIVGGNTPLLFSFMGRTGFALTDSRLNREIRIRLDDGKEAVGIVESYDSILSPPKVRLLYEEKVIE